MISTNDFRSGIIILLDNKLYMVLESKFVKSAQRRACIRAKLKDMQYGTITEMTFRSDEKVEQAFIEGRKMEFIYRSGDTYHFVDSQSFEDMTLERNRLDDIADFLKENNSVIGEFYQNKLIHIKLPNFIELKVTESTPAVRGDTVKLSMKEAVLETGGKILVPLFVEPGDKIKIDTRTKEYIGRV